MEDFTVQFAFSIGTFIAAMVVSYFGFVSKVNARLTKVEIQGEIFWKVVDPHLAAIIHSPHAERRDYLVDELLKDELPLQQLRELSCLLELAIAEEEGEKKLAAALLLARVESKIARGLASVTLKSRRSVNGN